VKKPSLLRALVIRLIFVIIAGFLVGYAILYSEFRVGLMGLESQSTAVQVEDLRKYIVHGAAGPELALPDASRKFYSLPDVLDGYQILRDDGVVVASAGFTSDSLPRPVNLTGSRVIMQHGRDVDTGERILAAAIPFDDGFGPHWLRVVRNLEDPESLVAQLMLGALGELLPTLPFLIISTIAVVVMTVHSSLQPLRIMSQQAAALSSSNLHDRLQAPRVPQEIALLVDAVNFALDRLEADYRAQRDFTANAAHELRTPLATLRARLEARFSAEELGDIGVEIEQLARLVEQLLYLARLDSAHEFELEELDVYVLGLDVARELAPRLVEKGHSVVAANQAEPVRIRGNATLLRAVFRNLIENAVQHTPAGTEIALSIRDAHTIAVEDNGPGIPKEEADKIFERFRRGHKAGAQGAGLGLAIAQRIMARHDAQLRLDATTACGTRFLLEFRAIIAERHDGSSHLPQ
jgi:two-component system, OmpR family, sensor histidine kinase TctE